MKNLSPHIQYPLDPLGHFWFDLELLEMIKNLDIISVSPNEFLITPYFHRRPDSDSYFELIEISEDEIQRLQKNSNSILLFNWALEGFPNEETQLFRILTNSAKKIGIPGEKIVVLTGNLFEEQNYNEWQKIHSPDFKINVFSIMFFEMMPSKDPTIASWPTIDDTVKSVRNIAENDYRSFLCLNQAKRNFRNLACYKIFISQAYNDFYISYNKFSREEFLFSIIEWADREFDLSNTSIMKFIDSSPSVIDREDFDIQWSLKPAPVDFFKKSICSIVNETLYESYDNRSLFYTEKTFRPMIYNHPLMIIGQAGANTYLEKLGYKLYDDYFDLSFDTIQDNYERLATQIEQIEELSQILRSMTPTQRVSWFLAGVDVIHYNRLKLLEHATINSNMEKLKDFLKNFLN